MDFHKKILNNSKHCKSDDREELIQKEKLEFFKIWFCFHAEGSNKGSLSPLKLTFFFSSAWDLNQNSQQAEMLWIYFRPNKKVFQL